MRAETLETACKVRKKRVEGSTRGTPAFRRQQKEGARQEEKEAIAKEGYTGKNVMKKGVCNSAEFQKRSRKISNEKHPGAFVTGWSLLFRICKCSFSEVVEEASRLQWFKE